jgi:hypothetical protein
VGYLNRIRTVPVEGRGNDYLAVDIAALRGEKGKVKYTYFSCRVSGTEAQRVIREELADHIKAGKKVLVRFKAGDLIPDAFTFKTGPNAGKQGLNIKSHLLFIYSAKVNGEEVYRAPKRDDAANPAAATPVQTVSVQSAPAQPQSPVARIAAGMMEGGMTEEEVDAALYEMDAMSF